MSSQNKLPTIKGYCKDCYFIRKANYGLKCYRYNGYERECVECDYCSCFEPKKEKCNDKTD